MIRGYTKEQNRDLSVYGMTITGPDGKRIPPEDYFREMPAQTVMVDFTKRRLKKRKRA